MDTIKAIKQRRSTRVFNNKKIDQKDIKTILECAMSAPTARNQQGWRFIVVDDKEILSQISNGLEQGKMAKDASHAIVVCYDIKDEVASLYWQQDSSASTQNILLGATSLGIASVWIAVYPREQKVNFVTNLFKLPRNLKPLSIVALGYKEGFLKELNRFDESKIRYNEWS